jgi:plasmid stabilization system protein ParE
MKPGNSGYSLSPLAEEELREAIEYYASKASRLVAKSFLAEFKRAIAIVVQNQKIGKMSEAGLRIFPFHHFPYSIIYQETPAGPLIFAIANQYRKPLYWLDKT